MKKTLLRLSIIAACASHMAYAESTDTDTVDFSQAYQQYNQAVEANNQVDIITYAKQAYDLGATKFGADSIDSAKLAMNWANAIVEQSKQNNNGRVVQDDSVMKAQQLFESALTVYRQKLPENDIAFVDPLVGLAETTADDAYAKKVLFEAIDVAQESDNELTIAEVKTLAFYRLTGTDFYTRAVRSFAFDAYDIYVSKLPENAIKRVNATYLYGALNEAMGKHTKAVDALVEVIKQYQALPYSHPHELRAHALLVDIYQKRGQGDQATEHCIAIGKMTPWNEHQEQTPLFRTPPDYPKSYAKRGKSGWVQLEFTVDEQGFVQSPQVLDSKGGSQFEKESIEALSQWRYAPKFVDGKPIKATSTVQIDFSLG
jgi:TonB family protein